MERTTNDINTLYKETQKAKKLIKKRSSSSYHKNVNKIRYDFTSASLSIISKMEDNLILLGSEDIGVITCY